MNSIETIICLILLLMAVPDLCRKLGRPALANVCFVVFGLALGPLVETDVATMIKQAGEVGFLLVLFEVGLEIDLPKLRELLPSLRFAALWLLVQYPIVLGLAHASGLNLAGRSAGGGGADQLLHEHGVFRLETLSRTFGDRRAHFVLQIMIALEVLAIVVLSIGGVAVKHGLAGSILLQLAGMAVTIYLISRFASHVVKLFQWIIQKTTQWRVHFLVLLVLIICAVGERLGLSAAKTAFFLGLFMSRAEFEGIGRGGIHRAHQPPVFDPDLFCVAGADDRLADVVFLHGAAGVVRRVPADRLSRSHPSPLAEDRRRSANLSFDLSESDDGRAGGDGAVDCGQSRRRDLGGVERIILVRDFADAFAARSKRRNKIDFNRTHFAKLDCAYGE